jgi:hypothetical protein
MRAQQARTVTKVVVAPDRIVNIVPERVSKKWMPVFAPDAL